MKYLVENRKVKYDQTYKIFIRGVNILKNNFNKQFFLLQPITNEDIIN